MSLAVNLLLGLLIFGYAAWTLTRFVKRSKKGKCAGCELEKTCSSGCSTVDKPDRLRS
ncbi:hydrolase [Paenibacillus sp. J31TS4]|uniref:FeoB-associated Cys-rich membrane protein n=1 Tax=Paenibacillus sp. J31TS4 TaxID=2807195 RepID=UPI001B16244E|nr:FeoB-associated Cys-rich membrane protein [Paenibacillus sp. J31TS4]GIP38907.1 hydrolase [Paenibacillus sp. J31TS4]